MRGRKRARRGLRAVRPTRPAGPAFPLAGPSEDGATQGGDLDFALWHAPQVRRPADSGGTSASARRKVLAGRNPLLLLRFAGSFLLRLAERRFNGLLLKAPPRKERLWGRRPAERVFLEQPLPQSIGIGLGGVAHPAHHPAHYLVRDNFVPGVLRLPSALWSFPGHREILYPCATWQPPRRSVKGKKT